MWRTKISRRVEPSPDVAVRRGRGGAERPRRVPPPGRTPGDRRPERRWVGGGGTTCRSRRSVGRGRPRGAVLRGGAGVHVRRPVDDAMAGQVLPPPDAVRDELFADTVEPGVDGEVLVPAEDGAGVLRGVVRRRAGARRRARWLAVRTRSAWPVGRRAAAGTSRTGRHWCRAGGSGRGIRRARQRQRDRRSASRSPSRIARRPSHWLAGWTVWVCTMTSNHSARVPPSTIDPGPGPRVVTGSCSHASTAGGVRWCRRSRLNVAWGTAPSGASNQSGDGGSSWPNADAAVVEREPDRQVAAPVPAA